MHKWTTADMPSQRGKTVVITGTGGLGFETALAMARAGATVIVAGRNPSKGATALAAIRSKVPDSDAAFEPLDLASLDSIRSFARRMQHSRPAIDVLINNAAVMAPPTRRLTADGFELQFGTNYLGHHALTAQLLPLLRKAATARVISLSSLAARDGSIRFDDLQSDRSYKAMEAYSQSKLACLMYALELQRRSDAAGWGVHSIAVHPGISRTDLLPNGTGPRSAPAMIRRYLWFLFQPAAQGALPTLFAATSREARGGGYYGPHRLSETRGFPAAARIPPQALVAADSERLWVETEHLTGLVHGR